MKNLFFILIIVVSFTACKTKKRIIRASFNDPKPAAVIGTTVGKVSHMYQETGCATVVIVKSADGEMTLIPKDKLSAEFDVDGLMITFNYRSLKMPNPQGCNVGMPAELTDIAKK